MESFLQYILPSIIAAFAALISTLITILTSRSKIKNEIEKQQKQFSLDNAKHIRQIHNEERFKIYHSLSEKSLEMVQASLLLFPPFLDRVPHDEKERHEFYLERYKKATETYNDFSNCLFANAPFINENLFKSLINYRELCRLQIAFYPELIINKREGFDKSDLEIRNECWERSVKISTIQEKIISALRKEIQEDEEI